MGRYGTRVIGALRAAIAIGLVAAMPAIGQDMAPSAQQIQQLKQNIADQLAQIEKIKASLQAQQEQLDRATGSPDRPQRVTAGQIASTTPMTGVSAAALPAALPVALPRDRHAPSAPRNPCEADLESTTPAYLRIGGTCVVPVGFMDLTAVWRDKNAGSSIGTNFGSVPFNNTTNAKNSEFRFSPQNSRVGFRVDGDFKGAHFMAYNEFDFLGTGGATNYTVTNGAFVPRLRLFWLDVRKGDWEVLAGQSWSMLTPNRKGISALPSDLFISQVVDVNYMAGLTWTRQAGMRVLYHPSHSVTLGLSLENPDQYIGGSAGGSGITLPKDLGALASAQLDNAPNIGVANTVLAVPTLQPDIIAKLAYDPSSRFHFELAGLQRSFKIWNPNTSPAIGAGRYSAIAGGGVQFGLNAEVVKNFRLITTNYWSDGGGRYLFGQAPDVIVRADGRLSAVHAGGTVDGFEATVKSWLLYAYAGGIYINRNAALDVNGTGKIGYGYAGAPSSQNRLIQEFTFGFNQTIWKNPRYGAINAMGQYEYLTRSPWAVATGAPESAHDNTIYFNLRYTLPGSMPNF